MIRLNYILLPKPSDLYLILDMWRTNDTNGKVATLDLFVAVLHTVSGAGDFT